MLECYLRLLWIECPIELTYYLICNRSTDLFVTHLTVITNFEETGRQALVF